MKMCGLTDGSLRKISQAAKSESDTLENFYWDFYELIYRDGSIVSVLNSQGKDPEYIADKVLGVVDHALKEYLGS